MLILEDVLVCLNGFNVILMIIELYYCLQIEKRKKNIIGPVVLFVYLAVLSPTPFREVVKLYSFLNILGTYLPFVNFYYLLSILWSILVMYLCFEGKMYSFVFYAVSAFVIEHFCSHAMQLFTFIIQGDHATIPPISRLFELCLLSVILFGIHFYWRKRNQQGILYRRNILYFVIIGLAMMSGYSSLIYYWGAVSPITHIYELCISILLFTIQFDILNISEKDIEKKIMEQLLKEQAKQQESYNANIQYINVKYHDLKNQINVLKLVQTEEERKRGVEKLEQALLFQETWKKTGNEALDVVLMEKHIMCQKEGISLSCMIDGTACDFMENEDVCMLFGNALNNAIEAAGKCVNEKKYISLNVKKENAFTRIYVENYFTGARKVEGGRFCTTKDNELFEHGYGLKSIRILVSKYNGHVTITTEDDLFCLNILFPL